ncbi:hypothetical protein AB0I53_44140 [Saccharopolyspora sp. NPDC050389]|uniref:hypothetical protein n=1 Tax=Saccharopolyspora sp. NPDC050389 TaxID=3155516 RepID=UPI003407671C
MSTHLISDTTVDKTRLDSSRDAVWLRLSATLTDEVPVIADREDLLVTIAPGAGHGSPACYFPHHATIEIDGTHLGTVDPTTMTPDRLGDRARYATAWGLLTHECAHARHSVWEPPRDAPPGAVDAAMLLEESRIEASQIRRRPDDRHWLRASATNLILADTHANDPTRAPGMTPHAAAHAAALLQRRRRESRAEGLLRNRRTAYRENHNHRDTTPHRAGTRCRAPTRSRTEHGRNPRPCGNKDNLAHTTRTAADARRTGRRRATRRRGATDRRTVHPHHPTHRAQPTTAARYRL